MNEMGYWRFNALYYIKIKEQTVDNITIKICNDMKKDDFLIAESKVTCRLHFRRWEFLALAI